MSSGASMTHHARPAGPGRGPPVSLRDLFPHAPAAGDGLAAIEAQQAGSKHMRPIVTEVLPAGPFYKAEDYHQQYLKNRGLSSCSTKGEG